MPPGTRFQPLRVRIQRAVDRRFSRGRDDAVQTLDALHGELVTVLRETVPPSHVGLGLRGADDRPPTRGPV